MGLLLSMSEMLNMTLLYPNVAVTMSLLQCGFVPPPLRDTACYSTLLNLGRPRNCFQQRKVARVTLCQFRAKPSTGPAVFILFSWKSNTM